MAKRAAREEDKYAATAAGYDELHKEEQVRKIKLILQHARIKPTDTLLDVGCGTGFSFTYWPTKRVTGAEPSKAMINQAPKQIQGRIMHIRAEDMSIFHDHEFDVVVSLTAIHNFTGIEDGLKEMKRVGKNNFIFSVLKRSATIDEIDRLIRKHFRITQLLEEQHDRIYFCT